MRSTLLLDRAERTFVVVFDKGEEVIEGLTMFAGRERLRASHITAIGALSDVTLGYFDWVRKHYEAIRLNEQVEVVTLAGDVAVKGQDPQVHAHVTVGRRDGSAYGGHLLEGHVRPTLEIILVESPAHLRKKVDEVTGLALIDIGDEP